MDKNVLKELSVLYVEDDSLIRNELSVLLSKFFKNVITASNGLEGLETYTKNKSSIDMIISDINMPELSGIDMVKGIRTIDENVPVVFTTAYSDKEFLVEAIKLKADDYVIKPIDVRNLINVLNKLGTALNNELLLEQKRKELTNYKQAIDSNNIVIKTDENFNITSLNELFSETTSFKKDFLIGKNFYSLKHDDVSITLFDEIKATIDSSTSWKGKVKYITNDDTGFFIADTYAMSTYDEGGLITGVMFILNDITKEISQKRNTQKAMMKDKGEIFSKSKETSVESKILINELTKHNSDIQKNLKEMKSQKDKYMYNYAKANSNYKNIKADLAHYKNNEDFVHSKSTMTLKTNKENSDFRLEIKRLKQLLLELKEDSEKSLKQMKINHEVEIDDLSSELDELKDKVSNIGNLDIVNQKIQYWKEKAKSESRRATEIEKRVVQSGDESFLKKIFSNK